MPILPRLRIIWGINRYREAFLRPYRACRRGVKPTQAEAWAKFPRPFGPGPFGAQTFLMSGADSKVWRLNLMLTRMGSRRTEKQPTGGGPEGCVENGPAAALL